MIILLCNDDGIHAEGIQTLRAALARDPAVQLYVVAPDRERSATGHAITTHRPLFADRLSDGGPGECHAVTGTPADCVKLALDMLLPHPPDLVVSGINRGANLGTDVFYSGTVSAAIEATILGLPALAVSLCAFEHLDYGFAAAVTARLARLVAAEGLPPGTLLNVNVPAVDPEHVAGVQVTRLGRRLYEGEFDRRVDPRGKVYYWLAGRVKELYNDPDTDVVAVQNNQVSITPIHLDLTDRNLAGRVAGWDLAGCLKG